MHVSIEEPQLHLWTRDEYSRMADAGLFDGKRVELIEGRIFEMPSMKSAHATSLTLSKQALEKILGGNYFLRIQMPLNSGEISQPEPDIAVIAGAVRDYTDEHPRTAVLVVEIADSSLMHDRTEKVKVCAKAGIQEYWIVNLLDCRLEVYRNPITDDASTSGFNYPGHVILKPGDFVSPLAVPSAKLAVADLLP
jgi:Uma2 family endonuclease